MLKSVITDTLAYSFEKFGPKLAVDDGSQKLTYRQLDEYSNRLVGLLKRSGIGKDDVVGIYMNACVDYIIAVIAVLKSGSVFAPLNIDFPVKRQAAVFEKIQPLVLLTNSAYERDVTELVSEIDALDGSSRRPIINVTSAAQGNESGEPPEYLKTPLPAIEPDDSCYIITTSGSTGLPKSILCNHKGLAHFINWEISEFLLDDTINGSLLSAVTFDVSLRDIFVPLSIGGTLYIPDETVKNSPPELYQWLKKNKISLCHIVPTLFRILSAYISDSVRDKEILQHLRFILLAGEALYGQDVNTWRTLAGSSAKLVNVYGPSETTLAKLFYPIEDTYYEPNEVIPLGKPLPDTHIVIIRDEKPVAQGDTGEICIKTPYRSKGYVSDPELTKAAFIPDVYSAAPGDLLYKTGDLGTISADGLLCFKGRKDGQIKLFGKRIETGEIEILLNKHPQIHQAAVTVKTSSTGHKRLIAYIVLHNDTMIPTVESLRKHILQSLPAYMVPTVFHFVDEMPLTHSGKIDRNALPEPEHVRPHMEQPYTAPGGETEKLLSDLWCRVLQLDRVGIHDNFFDLGGDSILAILLDEQIQNTFAVKTSLIKLFQFPTISDYARFLSEKKSAVHEIKNIQSRAEKRRSKGRRKSARAQGNTDGLDGVAIIGMSCRFPGANSPNELWQNLCEGKESIHRFSDGELDPSIADSLKNDPRYIKAKGIINDADKFDARFFNINPREAAMMDPQHRVFFEEAHHALEDGGYNPWSFKGMIGVFGGSGINSYFAKNILSNPQLVESFGEHQTNIANGPDYLTTRVSYKLNLNGPSISLYTGCSLSLVAVCLAFDSLETYQCDMALAGGVFIRSPLNSGYLYQEGGMESLDGHCRPFDEKADGTVFSDGVGVVLLKRLFEAIEDRDHIYAVIRGTAMNNDGSKKVSFAAPSVDAQARVIAQAQANAQVSPETISYIEAHGTATPVGDPIEIEALTQAFQHRTSKRNFCAIGSIKSNVGHLDAAAGIAGLIKTALMLHHKKIPPTLHYTAPNPMIDFSESPFFVNNELMDWSGCNGVGRRAGVTSLGVGGTNAHVVLEEAPNGLPDNGSRNKKLITLSAKTEQALGQVSGNLLEFLKLNPAINMADVAFTLQVGRNPYDFRRVLICENSKDAAAQLEQADKKNTIISHNTVQNRDVVFMFPGQGSQYANMGLELYKTEAVFRDRVDMCAERIKPLLGLDIRDIMYPKDQKLKEAGKELQQTFITQPALFTIEYALAHLWLSWGILPSALIGHSIGEYVAACISGVFSLEDALTLVAARGRLMQSCPRGSMLAVPMAERELIPLLHDTLSIAVINGPKLCVVSGPESGIDHLKKELQKHEVESRKLYVSHAFHSAMMEPVLDEFFEQANKVTYNRPEIPFISNVSGTFISDDQALDPHYWTTHGCRQVRFSDGIAELMKKPERVFLEVGPGRTLVTLAQQHPDQKIEQKIIASMRHPGEDFSDDAFILTALGRMWLSDVNIDWHKFYVNEQRRRIPLPAYPFERQRFWIEPGTATGDTGDQLENSSFNNLCIPAAAEQSNETAMIEPAGMSPVEREIARIFQSLLGLDTVEPNDNFFDLGGDSLIALRLFAEIEKSFSKKYPVSILYQAPTVAELANLVSGEEADDSFSTIVTIQKGGTKPPLFLVHGAGGNILLYRDLAKHLGPDYPVYGIQSRGLDSKQPILSRIEDMARVYIDDLNSLTVTGPFLLGGYCMGGSVAYEMAQQLRVQNKEVARLIFLETYNFSKIPKQTFWRNLYHNFQKVAFHGRNFLLLPNGHKHIFIREKAREIARRRKVWYGDIAAKFSKLFAGNENGYSVVSKIWKMNDDASLVYEPKPYAGNIVQFLPKKEYAHHVGPELGFENLVMGNLESITLPVYPAGMLVEPFVEKLADNLRIHIDKVEKDYRYCRNVQN